MMLLMIIIILLLFSGNEMNGNKILRYFNWCCGSGSAWWAVVGVWKRIQKLNGILRGVLVWGEEHSNSECLFMLLWSFNNTCAIQNTDGNLDYTLPLVSHRTHSDSSWGIASKARNVIPPHACILNFFVGKCNRNYVLKRLKSFSFTIRSQVREINYTIYYIYGTLFGLSSFLFFKYQLINILN